VRLVETKAKEEMTLLARAFTTRETALKQEFANLRQAEKDLSKRLHDKIQEVVELEAKILPLRTRAIKLEEAAEATKAKVARLEERSTNQEVQLGRAEAELLQQVEKFKKAEAELTEDVVDAYAAGFEDILAQVAYAHPEMEASPFATSNRVLDGHIVPRAPPS